MGIPTHLRNRTASYVLAAGFAVSLLSGCSYKETTTELSDILYDDAKVVRMEHENGWLQPIPMRIGHALIINYIPHPERNIVVFDGSIDFAIDNKEIYARFAQGDLADVSYQEVYNLTFEDLNKDGIREETGKKLIGYRFLDAKPQK